MNNLLGPKKVVLADLKTTFFTRIAIDENRVVLFSDLFEAGERVRPIIISNKNEIIDGRHRVEAMRRVGIIDTMAYISKTDNAIDNIIQSVRENLGGSLPPTQADLEHTIEMLVNQGMKKTEIITQFPIVKSLAAKYYKHVIERLHKKQVDLALDRVVHGTMSIQDAATKYKVDFDELQGLMSTRRERSNENILGMTLGHVEQRVRALSQMLSKGTVAMVQQYRDNAIGADELKQFRKRVLESSKRIARGGEQLAARIDAVLRGPVEPGVVDDVIAIDAPDEPRIVVAFGAPEETDVEEFVMSATLLGGESPEEPAPPKRPRGRPRSAQKRRKEAQASARDSK